VKRGYYRRPKTSKDGKSWRDYLKPDEAREIARYESLLNGNEFLTNFRRDLPPHIVKIRQRAVSRCSAARRGARVGQGPINPSKRLDWNKVLAIRASDEPYAVLAERYGVKYGTIYAIRANRVWKLNDRPAPVPDSVKSRRAWETRRKNACSASAGETPAWSTPVPTGGTSGAGVSANSVGTGSRPGRRPSSPTAVTEPNATPIGSNGAPPTPTR